jgi:hypothetical protein
MCHETMSPPTLSLPTMSHAVHMRPCLCRPPARPPSLLALAHALPSLPISLPSLSRFTSHWLSGGESSKMSNSIELSENTNCLGARDFFFFYCLGALYSTQAPRHRYIRAPRQKKIAGAETVQLAFFISIIQSCCAFLKIRVCVNLHQDCKKLEGRAFECGPDVKGRRL